MAITNVNDALAGMVPPTEIMKALTGTMVAGRPHSLFYVAGQPSAAVAPSTGLVGASLTSYGGQIPFNDTTAGAFNYLARFQAMATIPGTLLLCDRLWHNSGIVISATTEQVFTGSDIIPPRDANGLSVGNEVYAGVEISTAVGAGVPTLTLKYTNEQGVAGKTATNTVATVASSIAGTFYPIGLAAGDRGIQRAESLTLSATWTTGVIHVVLYRVISRLELTTANVPNAIDMLTGGFPKLYNDSVPFLIFIPSTTTTSNIAGQIIFTQG